MNKHSSPRQSLFWKKKEKISQGALVKKKFSYAAEQPSEIRILKHLSDLVTRLLTSLRRAVSVMGV